MIEAIEIKLKDIAVASGAPINPRAMGSGPHTGAKVSDESYVKKRRLYTKKVVKNHVYRRDHENDLVRDRKETLRLEIPTVKTVRAFPQLGHRAYRDMALKAYAGRPMEAYLRYIAAR